MSDIEDQGSFRASRSIPTEREDGLVLAPLAPTTEMLEAVAHADWFGKSDLSWEDGWKIMASKARADLRFGPWRVWHQPLVPPTGTHDWHYQHRDDDASCEWMSGSGGTLAECLSEIVESYEDRRPKGTKPGDETDPNKWNMEELR